MVDPSEVTRDTIGKAVIYTPRGRESIYVEHGLVESVSDSGNGIMVRYATGTKYTDPQDLEWRDASLRTQ